MAIVYPHATLSPTKLELVNGWLPSRSWYDGTQREPLGSFRFDDPAGEVGMEGFLLGTADVPVLFVPLTYRDSPLDGAEGHLLGTMEHSELGTRYVYDACADPVFAQALANTVLSGARGALREFSDGQTHPTDAQAWGSGNAEAAVADVTRAAPYDEGAVTLIDAGPLELVVARHVGTDVVAAQTLTVEWQGQQAVVAGVRPA